jgi:hypothetical protein
MIHLGLAPDPVSPWWIYAAIFGQHGLPNDLESIAVLDPASAVTLEPWFNFSASDVLGSTSSPVGQLLVTYLEFGSVSFPT